jgi:hypothetical protein
MKRRRDLAELVFYFHKAVDNDRIEMRAGILQNDLPGFIVAERSQQRTILDDRVVIRENIRTLNVIVRTDYRDSDADNFLTQRTLVFDHVRMQLTQGTIYGSRNKETRIDARWYRNLRLESN